jgi:hypothetical protein
MGGGGVKTFATLNILFKLKVMRIQKPWKKGRNFMFHEKLSVGLKASPRA